VDLLLLLSLFVVVVVFVVATPAVVLLMTETPGRVLQLHAHFSLNSKHSIYVHKFLFPSSEWLPALNKAGRKPVNHAITEPLAPVLIER